MQTLAIGRNLAILGLILLAFTVDALAQTPTIEQLIKRIDQQDVQIKQLKTELTSQGEQLRRLPTTGSTSDDVPPNTPENGLTIVEGEVPADEVAAPESPAGLDRRLERLEQSMLGLESERSEFLESLSEDSDRIVNGRIHLDYWGFPEDSPGINTMETGDPALDPQDRFINRRVRFGIRGNVPPGNMSYRVELEFSGTDQGQVRDVWLGWDDMLFFDTVRIGNQKRPYGLDHLNSSNFNIFMERPFMIAAGNEDNRRLGILSYGVSENKHFNWRYGAFNLEPIQNDNVIKGDDYQVEATGRIATTWWYDESSCGSRYGHLAGSITGAFTDGNSAFNNQARFRSEPEARTDRPWLNTDRIVGAEAYQVFGLESVLNIGPLQLGGEVMNNWVQREDASGNDLHFFGGYMYISYFLTGEHIPWNRGLGILGRVTPHENFMFSDVCRGKGGRGLGAWQVAVRYSYADLNDDDIYGGIGESTTMALNWHWNSHARMQVNYIVGRIVDHRTALNAGGTAILSGDYQIVGTRFIIDF